MDPTITQGFENGGEIILQNVSQHTENMEVNKQDYSTDQSSLTANYSQDFTVSPHIQAEGMQMGVDSYKIPPKDAPVYVDTTGAPAVPGIVSKDNESLDNVPSEPYCAVGEQLEQVSPEESYNSAYMLEHQSENTYMPEKVQEQQPFEVVDDSNSGVQEMQAGEEQICDSAANESISTEQYVERNDEHFVSEYESENVELNECVDAGVANTRENRGRELRESVKVEHPAPENEIEDQDPSEVVVTEVVAGESVYIEDDSSEPVVEISKAAGVKEEVSAMEVVENTTENLVYDHETRAEMEVVEENVPVDTSVVDSNAVIETEQRQGAEEVIAVQSDVTVVEGISGTQAVEESVSTEEMSTVEGPTEETPAEEVFTEEVSSGELRTEGVSTEDMLTEDVSAEEVLTGKVSEVPVSQGAAEVSVSQEATEFDIPEEMDQEEPVSAPPRGRKTRPNEIPMHIQGVDIAKPVDQVPNGRQLPKPRIGVKVPYRNLTSQIITKQELEKEIIDRSRAKEESTSKTDRKFARSLTQRLASKIAPPCEKSPRKEKQAAAAVVEATAPARDEVEAALGEAQNMPIEEQMVQAEKQAGGNAVQVEAVVDNSKIQNDDDLLAILEGEGDEMPVLPKEVLEVTEHDDSNLKMLEREIALQQLQELPHQAPRQRIFKSRHAKTSPAPILTPQTSLNRPKLEKMHTPTSYKQARSEKPSGTSLKSVQSTKTPEKTNSTTMKLYSSPSPMKDFNTNSSASPSKQPIEVEPQVKVNMVLKTYSRKRKTSDVPEFDVPSPKRSVLDDPDFKLDKTDPLAIPTDVYVTKSSRIIKKKVIWDPDDELPARSPKQVVKPAEAKAKITEKPADFNENASEKAADKKPLAERVSDRKLSSDSRGSDKKFSTEKNSNKKIPGDKVAVAKSPEKKAVEKVSPKKTPQDKVKSQATKNESPKTKTPAKPKRVSEVDRLLMDEGAVKMLYDLKTTDDSPASKRKKDFISVEKAEKELIKRANQLKNDLVQNTGSGESPKTLRKKEAAPAISPSFKPALAIERKMSKDSTKSSVHTPPRSPSFQFSSHSQASMLIRRRSSSSISSLEDEDLDFVPKVGKKKSDAPKAKKAKRTVAESPKEPAKDENVVTETEIPLQESPNKSLQKNPNQFKSFTVKKSGKQIVIDLHYVDEKCFLDAKMLEKLTAALKKCAKDKDCAVVLVTSTSKAFCLGLDYSSLVASEEDERLEKASELADRVRDFLLCLLNFPKILIAGVQGDCVGLGVTMLPLFDMVIASDKATFSAAYALLGCLPEAGFLLSYPNLSSSGLASELFYVGQTLNADDALRRGLISKLCWPEKYKDTLKNIVTSIAQGSKQSLESTKIQLRGRALKETEAAIKSEKDILVDHWTSPECQENFAQLCTNTD